MYLRLLRLPGVARLVLAGLAARIPGGMIVVANVLLVQRATGSFAVAGAVDAAYGLPIAVASPLLGRLVDGIGQPRVLLGSAAVHTAALVGLVAAAQSGAGPVALCALAALAGSSVPPLSASIRALWPTLVEGSAVPLRVALGLESVSVEAFFILGPLLAGILVAVASPAAAVLCAAGLSLAGVVAFATAPEPRGWRPEARAASLAGALASPGLRVLLGANLPMGMAFGFLSVGIAGFAVGHGAPGASGVVWAAQAVGSAVGGLWYGSRSWRRGLAGRFVVLMALLAVGLAPLALAPSLPVLVALIAVGSLALAPVTATAYELVDRTAPAGRTTEAYTWLISANVAGAALGAALAGGLVQQHGARAAFAVAAGVTAVGALVAVVGRRALGTRHGLVTLRP